MLDLSLRSPVNLCALFATLLAGCPDRPSDTESDSATGDESSSSASASTTSGSSGEVTTTDDPTMPTTTSPGTTTDTTSQPGTTGFDPTSDDSGVCGGNVYEIELAREVYEHWLEHGEPPPAGETTGGEEPPDDTETSAGTGDETGGDEALTEELCKAICAHEVGADPILISVCHQSGETEDTVLIHCEDQVICGGRLHACIGSRGAEIGDDPVGAWFARAAHDEEASVVAFVELERELAEHGAPAELLARLREAAADEVRHAETATALALRHGGQVQRPRRTPTAARSLLAIARENAVEGCVRETWAALSAAHQARSAADPEIRAAMVEIAADEARHAELAWALDVWLQTVLSDSAWREVEAARRDAAEELTRFVTRQEHDAALVRRAGVPDRAAARALSAGLRDALWSVAA